MRKIIKKVTVTAIALFAIGFSDVKAQENETVIIRTYEYGTVKGEMVTATPNGEINQIELPAHSKNLGANTVTIQSEINKWKKQGYKLTHVSTGKSDNIITNIFILEK
jgi:hypothetical protein